MTDAQAVWVFAVGWCVGAVSMAAFVLILFRGVSFTGGKR